MHAHGKRWEQLRSRGTFLTMIDVNRARWTVPRATRVSCSFRRMRNLTNFLEGGLRGLNDVSAGNLDLPPERLRGSIGESGRKKTEGRSFIKLLTLRGRRKRTRRNDSFVVEARRGREREGNRVGRDDHVADVSWFQTSSSRNHLLKATRAPTTFRNQP